MKGKVTIVTSWLLVLLTMIIIFNFSGQSGTQSSQVSEGVIVEILGVVMDKEEITPPVVQKFQLPVRKLAHFGIYMLLGFCMLNAFYNSFKIKMWMNILLSLLSCAVYATFDECHQGYSVGRGPSALDVLIDSSGALVGIGLFVIFIHFCIKKLNKGESRTSD